MCARKVLESPNWNHFLFMKTLPHDFAPSLSYDVINNTDLLAEKWKRKGQYLKERPPIGPFWETCQSTHMMSFNGF